MKTTMKGLTRSGDQNHSEPIMASGNLINLVNQRSCHGSVLHLEILQIRMSDIARVGGKDASLGELFATLKLKGVGVLDGFAVTTDAYWRLLEEQGLREN